VKTDSLFGKPNDLRRLANTKFQGLTEAEIKLLHAAPVRNEQAWCGPTRNDSGWENDPANGENWGTERQIRAALIGWLCRDPAARDQVDPQGISIHGARIIGTIALEGVIVPFSLYLGNCYVPDGCYLPECEIRGTLGFFATRVSVLMAEEAIVRGDVILRNGFQAEGGVSFMRAEIGGDLDCRGAILHGRKLPGDEYYNLPSGEVIALHGLSLVVKGRTILGYGFQADTGVFLDFAHLGTALDCREGTFSSLRIEGARVDGPFYWAAIKSPKLTKLDLQEASVAMLEDDEDSWPSSGNLLLNGFVYGHFNGRSSNVTARLKWLALQPDEKFTTQPYRQLAKVLAEAGDYDGAAQVLETVQDRQRRQTHSYLEKTGAWILKSTIGYGYDPLRAGWWILGSTAVGWILYRRSYLAGKVVPVDKDACECVRCEGKLPSHYSRFSPFIYSLENTLPLVKLGQADRWQLDPDPQSMPSPPKWEPELSPQWISWLRVRLKLKAKDLSVRTTEKPILWTSPRGLRWFLWFQILLGWLLATLFVAGVTGFIRRN
jgi:hypothetical protein